MHSGEQAGQQDNGEEKGVARAHEMGLFQAGGDGVKAFEGLPPEARKQDERRGTSREHRAVRRSRTGRSARTDAVPGSLRLEGWPAAPPQRR
jgi:hypothetical protein